MLLFGGTLPVHDEQFLPPAEFEVKWDLFSVFHLSLYCGQLALTICQ